ncbi:MAG TPA: helix-turn-helix transcriptional regulator [Acetobacteraceae bacterium]|nr:helix-turn-helix transcriptional regulator [Acetobacteraceae bacterium]
MIDDLRSVPLSITSEQCRMARAGLHISQADLARRANVAPATIAEFEKGRRAPYDRTVRDIQRVLEEAGATFVNGGVTIAAEKEK